MEVADLEDWVPRGNTMVNFKLRHEVRKYD